MRVASTDTSRARRKSSGKLSGSLEDMAVIRKLSDSVAALELGSGDWGGVPGRNAVSFSEKGPTARRKIKYSWHGLDRGCLRAAAHPR